MNPTAICSIKPWRPIFDITFDWVIIFVVAAWTFRAHAQLGPVALLFVGNRQRALGNLLHEASHRNLYRRRALNDWLAAVFLAPALTSDLSLYRRLHSRHHALLGKDGQDPDLIVPIRDVKAGWWSNYLRQLASAENWLGSVRGHLANPRLSWRRRGLIGIWWAVFCSLLVAVNGIPFAIFFVLLWFTAKATTFHAITMFREMCDHFGLRPGGIYSFTRDTITRGCWRWLIHPHNNGYHLSHHLMPSVPHYRLPAMQKLLSRLPNYARHAVVCNAYFRGGFAVIRLHSGTEEVN